MFHVQNTEWCSRVGKDVYYTMNKYKYIFRNEVKISYGLGLIVSAMQIYNTYHKHRLLFYLNTYWNGILFYPVLIGIEIYIILCYIEHLKITT
jgi:hypothetical protein